MDVPKTLPGVSAQMIDTPRLKQHVYFSGPEDGIPVVFLHGNFSSALYWEETMLALPPGYRGIAVDLRGYGWTEDKLIDATRGYRDWSDDLAALLEVLKIQHLHLVGWSMGGGVAYRFIADHPGMLRSVTLQAPVSPYGFGGTKSPNGAPCYADFAGSGGGVVNPVFVQRIQMGDRGTDDPNSPRTVINSFYYKPGFKAAREEDFLTGALMEKSGPERYPGDMVPSANWPNVAPGVLGPVNCWSPKYLQHEVPDLLSANPKPPILWIHGDLDLIVGDNSFFDFGALGKLGYVPGWPGDEIFPPQPMVSQIRAVFDKYAGAGGVYRELVLHDTGHGSQIEKPDEWNEAFHGLIKMT